MEVTQKVVRNGKEYNADSGDKHCIPTHFNTELDVWYASLHTFSKVTVTKYFKTIYIVNIRGLQPRLRKMISVTALF